MNGTEDTGLYSLRRKRPISGTEQLMNPQLMPNTPAPAIIMPNPAQSKSEGGFDFGKLLEMYLKAKGGGGSVGGGVEGMTAGTTGTMSLLGNTGTTAGTTGTMSLLGGLANGGPAKANTPYIVGEEGPEIMVPQQDGTVIPNPNTTTPYDYWKKPIFGDMPLDMFVQLMGMGASAIAPNEWSGRLGAGLAGMAGQAQQDRLKYETDMIKSEQARLANPMIETPYGRIPASIAHQYLPKTKMEGELSDTQLYSILVNSTDPVEKQRAADMLAFRRAQGPEIYSVTTQKTQAQKNVEEKMNPLIAGKTEEAKLQAEIENAAELERQKKIGQGEITKVEEKNIGQTQVSDVLTELKDIYTELDTLGAIVNTDKSWNENLAARAAASGVGQTIGGAVGTKTQSLRNRINQIRPLLINAIRKASQMGARGLDSEKELEFYLQAATDPAKDIQTNLAALKVLDSAYGLGMGFDKGKPSPKPQDKSKKSGFVPGDW